MAYRYPECESCIWHGDDDTCDTCEDGNGYEPFDEEAKQQLAELWNRILNVPQAKLAA